MTRAVSTRPGRKRTSSNGHRPHRSADITPVATTARRRVPTVAPSPPRWFTRPSRGSLPSLSSLTSLLPTDRLAALRRDLPATAMAATGMLALRLRELTGRDLMDLESLQELMSVYYRLAAVREQHANNQYDIDDFGFDREWTEALMPLFRVVARRYWRVEVEGTENIPRSGGALLVSNHAVCCRGTAR